MKKWIARICLLTFVFSVLCSGAPLSWGPKQAEAAGREELRGVWIASVYNIDFPSKSRFKAIFVK